MQRLWPDCVTQRGTAVPSSRTGADIDNDGVAPDIEVVPPVSAAPAPILTVHTSLPEVRTKPSFVTRNGLLHESAAAERAAHPACAPTKGDCVGPTVQPTAAKDPGGPPDNPCESGSANTY